MGSLEIITIDQNEKWDKIVIDFKRYDIYYLSNYVKAFQIHGDGDPILFYYKDENIKAINVVMKRDIGQDSKFIGKIPLDKYFDVTTPYGYGGFLIEGNVNPESLNILNRKYELYCKKNNIISEFVRFNPILKNEKVLKSIYDVRMLGKTVSIDLKSQDYIWKNLTSKNRNAIRKAKKNNVKIYWGRNAYLFNKFIKMYKKTMDKYNDNDYYYFQDAFYSSILHDFKYNFLVFYAVCEEEIIAMSIILFSNEQMHYHLSTFNEKYSTYAPTNLLLYEAACWGVNNGYTVLHLGGGLGSKEDNLYKFKKSFNKNSDNDFFIGRKIFNIDKYKELIEIRNKEKDFDESTDYFPKYKG